MNDVTRTVRRVLSGAPVSLRELGRRAQISHAQLARIVVGQRNATLAVAHAVADALDAISAESATAAARIRHSLTTHHRRAK